jgi:hypothetical protein
VSGNVQRTRPFLQGEKLTLVAQVHDPNESPRVVVWQWTEQYRVDDAEDRAVGANAKGQGCQGDRCESRLPRQASKRVADVLQQMVEDGEAALVTALLLDGLHTSQPDQCGASGGAHAHAGSNTLVNVQLEMAVEFCGQLTLVVISA